MDISEVRAHYGQIKKILWLILVLNWAVALAKIIFGVTSRTFSMTADGFHSLSDGASNIVGIIGVHFACQPVDVDHPYGHKKYETLSSLGIAALLFVVSFNLIKGGIFRIINPVLPQINIPSFMVMIFTLAINLFVMRYELKKGHSLKSDILVSDAMHTKADIFTSLSVIVTLIAVKAGFPLCDPIATFIISFFIARAGWKIIKESSDVLCDSAAIIDVKRITDVVFGIKGVKACHKIRTRGRPDDIHIDLHVQVHGHMHVDDAHKICYAIEDGIKNKMPEVTDVIVHVEPK